MAMAMAMATMVRLILWKMSGEDINAGSKIITFDAFLLEQDQRRNKQGMMVRKMMAKVATMEPWSNAFLILPTLEKC